MSSRSHVSDIVQYNGVPYFFRGVSVSRLRGSELVHIANNAQHATSSMGTVNKKYFIQPSWTLSLSFCVFFTLHDLSVYFIEMFL